MCDAQRVETPPSAMAPRCADRTQDLTGHATRRDGAPPRRVAAAPRRGTSGCGIGGTYRATFGDGYRVLVPAMCAATSSMRALK